MIGQDCAAVERQRAHARAGGDLPVSMPSSQGSEAADTLRSHSRKMDRHRPDVTAPK